MGDGLHKQQRGLHIGQTFAHDLDHIVAQTGAGLVQTRRIQQHKLRIAAVDHAVNAVACGLRLVGHNGDLLAHQGVGQAGLAHIGPAADGNHGGFCDVHR